jgi:hypothetical protein
MPASFLDIHADDIQATPEYIDSGKLNLHIIIPAKVPVWRPHISISENCTPANLSRRSALLTEAASRQSGNANDKHNPSLLNKTDKAYIGKLDEISTLPDGIFRNRQALPDGMLRNRQAQGTAQGNAQGSIFLNNIKSVLKSRNTAELQEALKTVVGSGGGLTPQGDDFLCGFLLTDYYFRDILYPQLDLSKTIKNAIEYSRQATTCLSWNLMQCAAEGSADERIMNCIDWLASDHPESNLPYVIEELLTYGSSSGLETLAGMTSYIHAG